MSNQSAPGLSTSASQTVLSLPTTLIASKGAVASPTASAMGLPPSTLLLWQGDLLPNAVGLLLVALIGMVAVSRRAKRQVGKEMRQFGKEQ